MPPPGTSPFQRSLFDPPSVSFDGTYRSVERVQLDETSWLDYAPAWVAGSDALFEEILHSRKWAQRSRWMYDHKVLEPRLTAPWNLRSGIPLSPPILEEMRVSLSQHYGVTFDSVGFNLYRDGQDAVAWHGDRILEEIKDPIVVLVSLGEARKFLLRPKGGGSSRVFHLGRGDLLVTGGTTQRTWDHAVPRVAKAGPRISLAFRYGMDVRAYGKPVPPTE